MLQTNIDLTPFRRYYSEYAQRILADLGMSDLKQPLRSEVLGSIDKFISQSLTHTLLTSLDDEALLRINKLLKEGKASSDIMAYIVASTPGIESKIASTLNSSYNTILSEVRELTKDVAKAYQEDAAKTTAKSDDDLPFTFH